MTNNKRLIATNREDGGKLVREAWIEWARTQSNPKHSWLIPWEELPEADKEADSLIWEKIALPYLFIIEAIKDAFSGVCENLDLLELDSTKKKENK